MKVKSTELIAGLPAIEIRRGLRDVRDCHGFTVKHFGAARTQALIDIGLIEHSPEVSEWDRLHGFLYRISEAGIMFANQRFVPRLDRTKANRIVANFLQRVSEANTKDEWIDTVDEVHLFGSYITTAADFGDIDIAIKLGRKYEFDEYQRRNDELAKASGRYLGSFIARMCYAELELRKFLKARSPYLSLHDLDEVQRLGCEMVEIWPTAPAGGIADFMSAQRYELAMQKLLTGATDCKTL